ncbi:iron-containing alcohol dehydrogenase, partial [candidate division KSB1 bacterium]|nr:iron-containing alcohol dehydrogenase [candidate division KSB1 bacterium]
MQEFDYQPNTRVIFGENAIDNLGASTKELGVQKALLVSDPGLAKAGHVERAVQSLSRSSFESV